MSFSVQPPAPDGRPLRAGGGRHDRDLRARDRCRGHPVGGGAGRARPRLHGLRLQAGRRRHRRRRRHLVPQPEQALVQRRALVGDPVRQAVRLATGRTGSRASTWRPRPGRARYRGPGRGQPQPRRTRTRCGTARTCTSSRRTTTAGTGGPTATSGSTSTATTLRRRRTRLSAASRRSSPPTAPIRMACPRPPGRRRDDRKGARRVAVGRLDAADRPDPGQAIARERDDRPLVECRRPDHRAVRPPRWKGHRHDRRHGRDHERSARLPGIGASASCGATRPQVTRRVLRRPHGRRG